jgi:nicotinate phosphoribosyltransferase
MEEAMKPIVAQIINTLADTDLYKLTMLKFVFQHYPEARVRYELKVRKEVEFTAEDEAEIKDQILRMMSVRFDSKSLLWLEAKSPFLGPDFLTYLKGVYLSPSDVHIWRDEQNRLCGIVEGQWAHTILWEIVCLAVISEVYFKNHFPALTEEQKKQIYEAAKAKGQGFSDRQCYFIEMGTRRRYSREVQRLVMRGLKEGAGKYLLGTSNVAFAAEFELMPQGTMAHEIFSAVAAMAGVENANNVVLGKWSDIYHGSLGVGLTDTFTTDFFLRTFGPFYAKLYDGLRHDSDPNPNAWTDRVLEHYAWLGIDARSKRLVYSNAINSFDRVDQILQHRRGECLKSFGIGTWFTNDLGAINGAEPLDIVMKLTAAQKNPYEPMRPACKLSDAPGKEMGPPNVVAEYKVKATFGRLVTPLDELLPR